MSTMWMIAEYESVATFNLRPSNTTSSGGKSLLIPTPYAIKMALLDRLIVSEGLDEAAALFPLIRDLEIYLRLPPAVAVNRTFQRVLRPEGKLWNTTLMRCEYCFPSGAMALAFGSVTFDFSHRLPLLLASINYFGRRGGFFQLVAYGMRSGAAGLDSEFINVCRPADRQQLGFGILQRMDDMRRDIAFEAISTFGAKTPDEDGGRFTYNIVLPFQLAYHDVNYTVYERVKA